MLAVDPTEHARVEQLLRQEILDAVFGHCGMGGAHALDDEGHDHGIGADALAVVGLHAVTGTVVIEIVAHGLYEVVGSVAADAAIEVQVIGQSLLLDEALEGQRDRSAL